MFVLIPKYVSRATICICVLSSVIYCSIMQKQIIIKNTDPQSPLEKLKFIPTTISVTNDSLNGYFIYAKPKVATSRMIWGRTIVEVKDKSFDCEMSYNVPGISITHGRWCLLGFLLFEDSKVYNISFKPAQPLKGHEYFSFPPVTYDSKEQYPLSIATRESRKQQKISRKELACDDDLFLKIDELAIQIEESDADDNGELLSMVDIKYNNYHRNRNFQRQQKAYIEDDHNLYSKYCRRGKPRQVNKDQNRLAMKIRQMNLGRNV